MFRNARIKLTAWYLLIIMLISVSFSAVIYRMLSIELDRFTHMQRTRIERRFQDAVLSQPFPPPDPELIAETKQRIIFMLFVINGTILFAAGLLGYILAGKTLKPIADMVDEQHRFVSDASHELRTPLTALKTSMEVGLRDKQMTVPDAKKILKENIEEINSLQGLSERLLQLSQYESHHIQHDMTIVDIHGSIQKAIHHVSPLARQKHMLIKQELLHKNIHGNPEDITDLFVILLDNAIKYSTRESPVTVTMEKHDKTITIQVIDCGIGIAKKDLPNIFDRFYRADDARTNNAAKGYGLGLAIAKKIVEAHHGNITATSTVRKGSTFQVSFRSS